MEAIEERQFISFKTCPPLLHCLQQKGPRTWERGGSDTDNEHECAAISDTVLLR